MVSIIYNLTVFRTQTKSRLAVNPSCKASYSSYLDCELNSNNFTFLAAVSCCVMVPCTTTNFKVNLHISDLINFMLWVCIQFRSLQPNIEYSIDGGK